jgi:putative ABC transport system ATP-binding protein
MQSIAIAWKNLAFTWPKSGFTVEPPDLELSVGESIFIHGPSGCGKSTLLSLISGVIPAHKGHLQMLGVDMAQLSSAKRDNFRGENLGIVFQQFNLIPYLDVMSNVLMPTRMFPKRLARSVERHGGAIQQAEVLFEKLGLPLSIKSQKVNQLSVGQQQRIAVARALIGYPPIVIADEPTSSLDEVNKNEFLELLLSVARDANTTVLLVSHDTRIASSFDHVLSLTAKGNTHVMA